PPGYGSAVLLRAGEVVSGAEMARARRNGAGDRDLARGPARLASALGIDGATDGTPLLDGTGPLVLTPGDPSGPVLTGPRVGVGTDTPWRFWIADDPTVSPFRRYVPRRTSGRPV
ncbi:MAG: DNA-3-methyladenine glycosylase, partial [Micromonosporaceae bacterium]